MKNESLAQVFSCEFWEICKNTNRRLLLIIAVSIVVKGELANKTVNYDTKTKAYVPISARSVSPGDKTGFRSSRSQTSN